MSFTSAVVALTSKMDALIATINSLLATGISQLSTNLITQINEISADLGYATTFGTNIRGRDINALEILERHESNLLLNDIITGINDLRQRIASEFHPLQFTAFSDGQVGDGGCLISDPPRDGMLANYLIDSMQAIVSVKNVGVATADFEIGIGIPGRMPVADMFTSSGSGLLDDWRECACIDREVFLGVADRLAAGDTKTYDLKYPGGAKFVVPIVGGGYTADDWIEILFKAGGALDSFNIHVIINMVVSADLD